MDFSNRRIENMRRVIAVAAVLVSLYYLYWRYTETFNLSAPVFSWSLFLAEAFGTLSAILFYITVWKPRERVAPPPLPGRTVDVFVATKNEPVEVLRNTLLACVDMTYPHRTVVLDDGNRPEVRALSAELGCDYLARKTSEHAKAGNLNFGLKHSTAEFVVTFDADHIPLPAFIDRLIGYFADEKIGFVQVPQEFYNIDSVQHRTDRRGKSIWAEQYLFFSVIQPGRDHWNAAYYTGSCAIVRRKALDDIGGFATGTITEDLFTSIRMHSKGWSSAYHREYLAYGIAAETLKPFTIQRQRWGIGSWQVFMRANPIFMKGLTLTQRICYLSAMIYPLEGLQKMVFYLTPPIALYTGVLPMRALDVNYLVHFIPYFLISTYGFNEMARGVGGQLMLEQYSMAKFFTYLKTMVVAMMPKRGKEFKVTPKGEGRSSPASLIIPQYTVILLSFTAMAWGLVELLLSRRSDSFIVAVNCFWALYNSGLALAVVNFDYKKLFQRRAEFRVPDTVLARYGAPGEPRTDAVGLAVADDITEDGMSLFAVDKVAVGDELDVDLMLPLTTVSLRCHAVRERKVEVGDHHFSEVGLRFSGISKTTRDVLSRYIYSSAVTKFMKEYHQGYQTFVARHFGSRSAMHERAARSLAYLPVEITDVTSNHSFAVIKDISETGLLLETSRSLSEGHELNIVVILGNDRIPVNGRVVRSQLHSYEHFPLFIVGVQFEKGGPERVRALMKTANHIADFILQ